MIVSMLWTLKGHEDMKIFVRKVLAGAISIGEKETIRGLGSEICIGDKAAVKIVHHLFGDCPCLNNIGKRLTY